MDLNTEANKNKLISIFPGLKDDLNFEILSSPTPIYNCIAWAMQFKDRWVDIECWPGHWWPEGVERSMSPSALIHAFEAVGFVPTPNCFTEDGFDKVALYKREYEEVWTHAARIISNNKEHSKFGCMFDASHSKDMLLDTARGLERVSYGIEYAYMKRPKTYKPESIERGTISVNLELLKRLI